MKMLLLGDCFCSFLLKTLKDGVVVVQEVHFEFIK